MFMEAGSGKQEEAVIVKAPFFPNFVDTFHDQLTIVLC